MRVTFLWIAILERQAWMSTWMLLKEAWREWQHVRTRSRSHLVHMRSWWGVQSATVKEKTTGGHKRRKLTHLEKGTKEFEESTKKLMDFFGEVEDKRNAWQTAVCSHGDI